MAINNKEIESKQQDYLRRRKGAYERLFDLESQDVQIVLRDLARFCRAAQSTFHVDARAHALAEGRREVWLRIQNHLNLDPKELWDLHRGE